MSALTLDSLVDVVTNTNGMLILLAVFTTVIAFGKTYQAFYPMVRATEKTPVFFECRSERIVMMRRGDTFSESYRAVFIGNGFAIVPEDGEWGEDSQEIKQPESQFGQVIADVDPANEYAFFLVRPDSFEAFRTAREVIWEQRAGLEVGWEPVEQDATIGFGSSGRSPAVQ